MDKNTRYRIRNLTEDNSDTTRPIIKIIKKGYQSNFYVAVKKMLLTNWRFQVPVFLASLLLSVVFENWFVVLITLILSANFTTFLIGVNLWNKDRRHDLEDLLQDFSIEEYEEFWLAEIEEGENRWKLVGSISLKEPTEDLIQYIANPRRTLELTRWSVAPEMRSRKLGARLLQHATDYANAMKYKEVVSYCSNIQQRALKVYKRAGFKKKKTLKYRYMFGIFRFNVYIVSKMC